MALIYINSFIILNTTIQVAPTNGWNSTFKLKFNCYFWATASVSQDDEWTQIAH